MPGLPRDNVLMEYQHEDTLSLLQQIIPQNTGEWLSESVTHSQA